MYALSTCLHFYISLRRETVQWRNAEMPTCSDMEVGRPRRHRRPPHPISNRLNPSPRITSHSRFLHVVILLHVITWCYNILQHTLREYVLVHVVTCVYMLLQVVCYYMRWPVVTCDYMRSRAITLTKQYSMLIHVIAYEYMLLHSNTCYCMLLHVVTWCCIMLQCDMVLHVNTC